MADEPRVADAGPATAPRVPPEIPDGWTTGPPDFIGLGAQWSGAIWWWSLLRAHPDMVSTAQETHALSGLGGRPMLDRDIAAYHRHFPRRDGAITGEWSTDYISSPAALGHIRACAPAARFLVILRDPVERYRSGVERWKSARDRNGKGPNLWAGRRDALARSFHGFGLRRFFEAYGADRLLVLQLERCLADPAAEHARTLTFLGLAGSPLPADLLEPPQDIISPDRPTSPMPGEPDDLLAMLEPDVRLLHSLVPDLDLSLWPSFRHLAGG